MNKMLDMMKEIQELNKTKGVPQRGGKKYTQVQDRMDVFRKHVGTTYGIQTFLVVDDGKRVVMKAIIKDLEGTIIGSGYAEEIRGQGFVNKTSCMENAETSSIGRALASLGLSGGEYASANEMDTAQRNEQAKEKGTTTQNASQMRGSAEDLKKLIQDEENAKYTLSYPGNKSGRYEDLDLAIGDINKWLWTLETNDEEDKDIRLMTIGAFFERNKTMIDIMRKEKPDELSEIDARIKRFEDE